VRKLRAKIDHTNDENRGDSGHRLAFAPAYIERGCSGRLANITRRSLASLTRGYFVSVIIHVVQLREKISCSSFDGTFRVFKLRVVAGWH
jgi:hypothetical protein